MSRLAHDLLTNCLLITYPRRGGPLNHERLTGMGDTPMPLVRVPEPFDHPDYLFELEYDASAVCRDIDGHHCRPSPAAVTRSASGT